MKTSSGKLMLKSLSFGYSGPMTRWKSYSFFLNTEQGRVYFSAKSAEEDKENKWDFSGVEPPLAVLEDLSEMARAGGAVGSPVWVDPLSRVHDAHTHYYNLYWADNTHTGPGTAARHIMQYLTALARQYAGTALPGEAAPKNTAKEIELLAQGKAMPPSAVDENAPPSQKAWKCASCGAAVTSAKFCSECGAPKAAQ